MAEGRAVPISCFTSPTQLKIARGFGNNYLNLPPIVVLDQRRGHSLFHLQDRLIIKQCFLTRLLPASPVKLAELGPAFHFIRQVCCHNCGVIILGAHEWLLPATISRIKTLACIHAQMHKHTHTQTHKRSWTHSNFEIRLKVCLGDHRSCAPAADSWSVVW